MMCANIHSYFWNIHCALNCAKQLNICLSPTHIDLCELAMEDDGIIELSICNRPKEDHDEGDLASGYSSMEESNVADNKDSNKDYKVVLLFTN